MLQGPGSSVLCWLSKRSVYSAHAEHDVKSVVIGAGVVILAILFLFLRSRTTQPKEKEFKSTDEFVQWLATEAVKDASQNNHVTLDYSIESIKSVDQILGKLHEQYTKAPATISLRGLSAAYGAYIGEAIRKNEPNVHWERDDQLGEKTYPLVWSAGHSYPMGWCERRIQNGEEDSVWVKYSIFKDYKKLRNQSRTKTP